jgi:hypothetical protein
MKVELVKDNIGKQSIQQGTIFAINLLLSTYFFTSSNVRAMGGSL